MKVWKKFGLLIVAITVMTGTYLLNTTEVYAIGPNDSGVPQVGQSYPVGNATGPQATIIGCTPYTIGKRNDWPGPLTVYFYKYTCSEDPSYPNIPQGDGTPLVHISDDWTVPITYVPDAEEYLTYTFGEFMRATVEETMTMMVMEWGSGSGPDDPTPCSTIDTATPIIIDHDTFKSEAPSKTVIALNTLGANSFFDLKVHAADAQTQANQKLLAQYLVGPNTKILVTENIYPRRDLSISENGSLMVLTWNNLPKNQPGGISAVVYNQIDGAYEIRGILDANGTATFTGFKLRPASTITICK